MFPYKGTEYPLSTKLRVAFRVQQMNNHKPYSEVFAGMDSMKLEDQISILYCAFDVANPEKASQKEFVDYCLDNLSLDELLEYIGAVMEGLMYSNLSPEEIEAKKAQAAQAAQVVQVAQKMKETTKANE